MADLAKDILAKHTTADALTKVAATGRNIADAVLRRVLDEAWFAQWDDYLNAAAKCPNKCQLPAYLHSIEQALGAVAATDTATCPQEVLDEAQMHLEAWKAAMHMHSVRVYTCGLHCCDVPTLQLM